MIYAEDITKFDCTTAELEERILFWIAVAGKNANTQAHKLEAFLAAMRTTPATFRMSPFQLLRRTLALDGTLRPAMVVVGLGKYGLLDRGYTALVRSSINLRTCTVEELQAFPGIGPKTARCFILHSREGARVAGLDRHVMRYLKRKGHTRSEGTPGNPREYARLELAFLGECDKFGMSPADFDLMLWKIGAGREL